MDAPLVRLHRSPGLTALFNAIKKSNKNEVLDLGPSIASNFQFFSELGCRFHFENFNEPVAAYLSSENRDDAECLEHFLKYVKSNQKFDVVLVWDLFSFLPVRLQEKLYKKLEAFLKPNSLFLVFHYVGSTLPKLPSVFKVLDQYQIEVHFNKEQLDNTVKITTAELLKSLPKFFMLRSYVNNAGMQAGLAEQILCYKPGKIAKETVFSSAEVSRETSLVDVQFRSPAIDYLLSRSTEEQHLALLDLGPKNVANEELWKQHYADVYSADLSQVLRRIASLSPQMKVDYLLSPRFLNFDDDHRFDVIVAWDVFNFLSEECLAAVGQRLASYAKDGTLLIVMSYTGNTLPQHPRTFVLNEKGVGLRRLPPGSLRERNIATIGSLKMQKLLPGFFTQQSYAVRPGMLKGIGELVFVYKDANTLAREKAQLVEEVMARRREREATKASSEQP